MNAGSILGHHLRLLVVASKRRGEPSCFDCLCMVPGFRDSCAYPYTGDDRRKRHIGVPMAQPWRAPPDCPLRDGERGQSMRRYATRECPPAPAKWDEHVSAPVPARDMEVCTAPRSPTWPHDRVGCAIDALGGCARHKAASGENTDGWTFEDFEAVAIARVLSSWRCPNVYTICNIGPEGARDFQERVAMRWRLAQLRGVSCRRRDELRTALDRATP